MEWSILDGEPNMDDLPAGSPSDEPIDYRIEIAFHELEIVCYVGDLKIVGTAHFGRSGRASSQRSSDYLRHFTDKRLTLSQVRIYRHASNELLDTVPFIIINLDRVDLFYAREIEGHDAGDPAMRQGVVKPADRPAAKPAAKPAGKPAAKPAK
jgi:hypothetical protein